MARPSNEGVYLVELLTDKAKDWIRTNVMWQSYHLWGENITVERRFLVDTICCMNASGLTPNQDYRLR